MISRRALVLAALILPLGRSSPVNIAPRGLLEITLTDAVRALATEDDAILNAVGGSTLNFAATSAVQVPWMNYNTLRTESPPLPAALAKIESDAYTPFIQFASAAYCSVNSIKTRTCGTDCSSTGFQVVEIAKNACASPLWYVGWDPRNLAVPGSPIGTGGTIIVAHEGTNSANSAVSDLSTDQVPLNATLFPNAGPTVLVHQGFKDSHQLSAERVFSAVRALIASKKTTNIITTGHSLGASAALLNAISIKDRLTNLNIAASVSSISFAMPRTGNIAWTDYAEKTIGFIRHVNNGRDPVPVILAMDFKTSIGQGVHYRQVKGELHIDAPNSQTWYNCPGRDNPNAACAAGTPRIGNNATVAQQTAAYRQAISSTQSTNPLVLGFNAFADPDPIFQYHNGPYNGIGMGNQCLNSAEGQGIFPFDFGCLLSGPQ